MNFQVSFEDEIVVFPHGEAGYNCTRIPSILTTSAGTLLAFGEARMFSCSDYTQTDIVYKRSLDNGKTWSNLQKWVALGPPGGLLLQSNRILIPGDYSTNSNVISGSSSTGFVMLNDFNGQIDKWYLGGEINLHNYYPNEGQAVELLPNANSIFINSRSHTTKRIGAYSNNGGITFNKVKVLNTLVQPLHGCEGSTIYHKNTGQLFYTGLAEISTTRTNLSLHMSHDNGEHWTYIKTICPGSSGYSSMTILNDQSIGLLYEKGSIMGGPASLTLT
ncbi:unnamed protein product, partial [Adineta steineri]